MKETVGIQELLRKYPQAKAVLERAGIHPEERTSLALAVSKYEVALKPLMVELAEVIGVPSVNDERIRELFWRTSQELIAYIMNNHHAFMRQELPRLENILQEAFQAHSHRHGGLLESLQAIFTSFKVEIEEHLNVEEQILFPRISDIERKMQNSKSSSNWSTVDASAFEHMKHEHRLADAAFKEIRELTANFYPPDDSGPSLTALYEGLVGLEDNLNEHISLENDFLWPVKAQEMAAEINPLVRAVSEAVDICPRTNQPCEAGSHAKCKCFWDCVAQAMGSKQMNES